MESLKKCLGLCHTVFEWNPKWGGQNLTQVKRQLLREHLKASLLKKIQEIQKTPSQLSSAEQVRQALESFSDLTQVPFLMGYTISLSHCSWGGAFLYEATTNFQLGLDLENIGRISKDVVKRVSGGEELQQAPHFAFLWSGKEAVFKSLRGPLQPSTLSAIELTDWRSQTESIWCFGARVHGIKQPAIKGALGRIQDLIVGIACVHPQLWSRGAR